MPNSKQTEPLDAMVARLEEANARAYEKLGRVEESALKSEQEAAHHPSEQRKPSAVPDRRSSRGRPAFLALIGILLAAPICVAAFAWQASYGDPAKQIIARWANAALSQLGPLAHTTSQEVAPVAAPMAPELAQWLQTTTGDLAKLEQRIEQIKTDQDQMVRDNRAVAEELKTALAQTARDNAALTEQLNRSQEQLAAVVSFWAAGFARKPFQPRWPVPSSQGGPQLLVPPKQR